MTEKINEIIMGYAVPDDQGNSLVCTNFALSKALVNGFTREKFYPIQKLDFDQNMLSLILVNETEVGIKID